MRQADELARDTVNKEKKERKWRRTEGISPVPMATL